MKKRSIVLLTAIVAVCGFAVFRRVTTKETFAMEISDPVVETVRPDVGNISSETALIGTVENSDTIYVYAKAGGDITSLNIAAGDYVNAGDAICSIDTKMVDSAKASLDQAQLSLQQAQSNLSREQPLYEAGDISAAEYDTYRNAVSTAQVQYDSAKSAYTTQMEYANVTAKISGRVELCNVEVNDSVNAGTLLCVISGDGAKQISFSVTERIRNTISTGDSIRIEKDDDSINASIIETSSMADSQTGLYTVKATVDDEDKAVLLSTGSMVKLYVVSSRADNVLRVPKDCVYEENGESYVYTCTDNILSKVTVGTGVENDDYIEIKDGLNAGCDVVSTWSSELGDGVRVRIKQTAEENASGAAEESSEGAADAAAEQ